MRKIRYSCAMSLDGYIAGPNGEYDWIPMDPDFDFQAMAEEFDTYLLGRKTFEVTGCAGLPWIVQNPNVRVFANFAPE